MLLKSLCHTENQPTSVEFFILVVSCLLKVLPLIGQNAFYENTVFSHNNVSCPPAWFS